MRARLAVIAGIAVFLTLAGTGIGYALWNATAQATGTVQSASIADNCTSVTKLVGGGFETPVIPNGFRAAGPGQYPGGWTPVTENVIEMWRNHNGVTAPEGQQIVELNGNVPGNIYQVVATSPGQLLRWSIKHKGRWGNDTMSVAINKDGDSLVTQQTFTTGTAAFATYQGVYRVPAGQTSTRISLVSVSTTTEPGMNNAGSVGNFVDDVTFGAGPCLTSAAAISNITLPGTIYRAGDVVQYTTTVTNSGGNASNASVYTASIPAGLVYVPGTLTVDGAAKTDAAGDDQAQIAGTSITARLGQGATSSVGGSLPPANTVTMTFRATIQASAQGGTLAYNSSTGYVDPLAPSWPLAALSQPQPLVTNVAPSADVAVTVQSLPQMGPGSGGLVRTWTFLLTNKGPADASGVQVVVTPSTGAPVMVNPRAATVSGGGTCTAFAVGSTDSTCTVTGTFASGTSRTITFTGTMPASPANNYAVTAAASTSVSFDPVTSNNSATGSAQYDDQVPSVPLNLTATRFSNTQINLSWQASNDNVAIAGYKIYRNGALVTTTTGTGTTFNDTGLPSNLPYWYWVQAVDTVGNASGNSIGAGAVTFATGTSYRVQYVNPNIPAGTQLCVVADANASAAGIKTQSCGGATTALRQWTFTGITGNDVYVRFQSGNALGWTVPDNNDATRLRLTQNASDTAGNSQWRIGAAWTGTAAFVEIRRTTLPDKCLDIWDTVANTEVQQYACHQGVQQRFALMAP